jgi:hypothetical protein
MGIIRHLFENSPSFIRGPISRRRVNVSSALQDNPGQFVIKIAQTQDELEQAFRVLHDSYVSKQFMSPAASQMRITPYHALPTTTTFIALVDNQVVGTMSTIKDGVFGVPTDSIFDLSFLRNQGRSLAEISSLAIDPTFRTRGGACFFLLMKYMWEYVYKFMGVDTIVISANPSQQIFYDDILLFDKIPQKKAQAYSFVEGAPAIGRYVKITDLIERIKKAYGRKSEEKNIHQFLFNSSNSQLFFPQRNFYKFMDPVMTPNLLEYFLTHEPKLFASIPVEKKLRLLMHYQKSPLANTLQKHFFSNSFSVLSVGRRDLRFDTAIQGLLTNQSDKSTSIVSISNVAKGGLRMHLGKKLIENEPSKINLNIAVAPNLSSQVQLEIVGALSNTTSDTYCCRVLDADSNWENFINYLQQDFERLPTQIPLQTQKPTSFKVAA